jgi:hypothetical protein
MLWPRVVYHSILLLLHQGGPVSLCCDCPHAGRYDCRVKTSDVIGRLQGAATEELAKRVQSLKTKVVL